MADFSGFECDKCGACCRTLIVEAFFYDCDREPRIYQIDGITDRAKFREDERCIILHDQKTRACPFLEDATNHCSIYPTRPVACVMVEAGDAKCQQARKMKGLPMLRDRNGNEPTQAMLEESAEEYLLDIDELL